MLLHTLKYILDRTETNRMNMRNPKKPHIQRMASVELKKTMSVMKCFICNQMFYSQPTFDDHMKLHSAKLSKNAPQQIQRKTMESFRMKKGGTTQNINNKEKDFVMAGQKRGLNQTATVIRTKVEQKPKIEDQEQKQIKLQRQELKQAEQALRKSTILIEKLQTMIEQKPDSRQQQKTKTTQLKKPVKQDVTQNQFLQKFIVMPRKKIQQLCDLIQRTEFVNKYLQSYQDQLTYLSQLEYQLNRDAGSSNRTKIQKIKSQIVTDLQAYVKDNTQVRSNSETQGNTNDNCNQNCLYLTNIGSVTKSTGNKKQKNQEKQESNLSNENVEIVQNSELCYCSECYMAIQYGQDCYREQKSNKNEVAQYHTECWQQIVNKNDN